MSQKQFNRSLSTAKQNLSIVTVKWTLRVKKKFLSKKVTTMTNGRGQTKWQTQGESIIISRTDVETVYQYARTKCDLRDHAMIRLPLHTGLRTREIATLMHEDINFETGIFNVLDSKKHRFIPIPMDLLTLQLINNLGMEGLVFRHKTYKKNEGKPLTNVTIWKLFKTIGEAAGVKKFTPRLCRHYFAAISIYPKPDEHGNRPEAMKIETLRRMLRHEDQSMFHVYLGRLVFVEDVQRDYNRLQNPYVTQRGFEPTRHRFYEEYCSRCIHEETCKFKQRMCNCQACSGYRFYKPKKELTKHV